MRQIHHYILCLLSILAGASSATADRPNSVVVHYSAASPNLDPNSKLGTTSSAYYDFVGNRCATTEYSKADQTPVTTRIVTPGKSFRVDYMSKTAVEIPKDSPTHKCFITQQSEEKSKEKRVVLGRTCYVIDLGPITHCVWKGISLESTLNMGLLKAASRAIEIREDEAIADSEFNLPSGIQVVSFQEAFGRAMADLSGAVQKAQEQDPQFLGRLQQGFEKIAEQGKGQGTSAE